MYSRQEASQLKKEFWTIFGQYMRPVLSAEGSSVNWLNYKTGEKDIYFRMNADHRKANIAIELTHNDPGVQQLYFEQFVQVKPMLHAATGEEWFWQLHTYNDQGKLISLIYTALEDVSIFRKEDWPRLISFFKPRIIALDEFWSSARLVFESLR